MSQALQDAASTINAAAGQLARIRVALGGGAGQDAVESEVRRLLHDRVTELEVQLDGLEVAARSISRLAGGSGLAVREDGHG